MDTLRQPALPDGANRYRAAQEAVIAGNGHVAVILLADIRELSLMITEELGKALRGEYGE